MGSRSASGGQELDDLLALDRAVALRAPLLRLVAAAAPRHHVVHVQPHSEQAVEPLALERRHDHRQRLHEVRRELHEQRALEQRLAHQPEVEVLEVAQAAVDELRRAARRARGEVGLLDQGDAVAARGGVERHARAGDPAAHDDEVEAVPLHRGESVCSRDHGRYVTKSPGAARSGGSFSCLSGPRWSSPIARSPSGTPAAEQPPGVRSTAGVRQ